ncbi:hypothetical protein MYO4S_00139 [Serratia phage 4S]|nr:hypothetical protein MYO4S_00139 [Serratia phage 4S]
MQKLSTIVEFVSKTVNENTLFAGATKSYLNKETMAILVETACIQAIGPLVGVNVWPKVIVDVAENKDWITTEVTLSIDREEVSKVLVISKVLQDGFISHKVV